MTFPIQILWLIPLLPLLAAGLTALMKRHQRRPAAALAIGSMAVAFVIACAAFVETLKPEAAGEGIRVVHNFAWFDLGTASVQLGWLLDPLSAAMLVMVTFVGSLIFIYSVGYMAHDENFTRFFCFLSLFAAAMLGLVIANSLLLLFICWELVGLASYLLIGFWFHKPSAAAAAKKAFITTRIGDLGFLLGMVWLYHETGTLLFYDHGNGCLEQGALAKLVVQTTAGGMALSTAISLLIFCGAVGKSGQVPLHVWLPDAMEGPTPVSALIHAATMVAAGVFLVARVFPLMSASAGEAAAGHVAHTTALTVVTWLGAITAVFAALIAVAQNDIKRILAYSTVSQLGYMMLGLGVGGPAVGMFHLLTHAFFKALLFLGAGSVIHGCHEEQDIRRMGGLRKLMPVTFATYAVGMMALSGVPLVFCGFWSKDEILHSAWSWPASKGPFALGLFGAFLTAFYMTRQMWFVFFRQRGAGILQARPRAEHGDDRVEQGHEDGNGSGAGQAGSPPYVAHESPLVMTVPLAILAVCTVLLSVFATPVWPWFHDYLGGHLAGLRADWSISGEVLAVMALSIVVVAAGIGLSWRLYSREVGDEDAVQRLQPRLFRVLQGRFFVDEFYEATVLRLNRWLSIGADWLDRFGWSAAVEMAALLTRGLAWISRAFDEVFVNFGFDAGCSTTRGSGRALARLQNGQAQRYLRFLGAGVIVLVIALAWMGRK